MSKPAIIGFPQSSYVMTARAVAAVKGVEVDFQPIAPGAHKGPDHIARHPYGKVPAFRHGELALFETSAIARYLDEAFEGPALQPASPADRARMEQWISVVNCYFYAHTVGPYILKYIFAPPTGPDRAAIDGALPAIRHDLDVLHAGLSDESPYFVGGALSLADLFVGPLLFGLSRFPEGGAMLAERPKLGRLLGTLAANPAFMSAFQGA